MLFSTSKLFLCDKFQILAASHHVTSKLLVVQVQLCVHQLYGAHQMYVVNSSLLEYLNVGYILPDVGCKSIGLWDVPKGCIESRQCRVF